MGINGGSNHTLLWLVPTLTLSHPPPPSRYKSTRNPLDRVAAVPLRRHGEKERHGGRAHPPVDGDRQPGGGGLRSRRWLADLFGQGAPEAAGLPPVGEPQVRQAGLPLSHQPRRVLGHRSGARRGVQRGGRQLDPGGAVAEGVGGDELRPRHCARLLRRARLHRRRLLHVEAEAHLPRRLRLLPSL